MPRSNLWLPCLGVRAYSVTMAKGKKQKPSRQPLRQILRWVRRGLLVVIVLVVGMVALWSILNPPTTIYMTQERWRLGAVDHEWVALDDIAPIMAPSLVAAEDANFCLHWGFDVAAIRSAIEAGANRGASTITQQVVKNVYLWHGRNWTRKAIEAGLTPLVEAFWSKKRIVEVYLNVAEFDEGVFGIEAASSHYFNVPARELSALQAARLAAILPAPKVRSASRPSDFVRNRTRQIMDGAATILKDGRASCLSD